MELKINNQTKQFRSDSLTVQTLIDLKFPQTKRNSHCDHNTIIPKQNYLHHLNEADDILIISATQGG
jgi:sulfur carrier protein